MDRAGRLHIDCLQGLCGLCADVGEKRAAAGVHRDHAAEVDHVEVPDGLRRAELVEQ